MLTASTGSRIGYDAMGAMLRRQGEVAGLSKRFNDSDFIVLAG